MVPPIWICSNLPLSLAISKPNEVLVSSWKKGRSTQHQSSHHWSLIQSQWRKICRRKCRHLRSWRDKWRILGWCGCGLAVIKLRSRRGRVGFRFRSWRRVLPCFNFIGISISINININMGYCVLGKWKEREIRNKNQKRKRERKKERKN